MSVDLPAPFSPINPTTSSALISIDTSRSAWTPGKRFSILTVERAVSDALALI